MALIKITESDVNRSKQPDEGWHLGRIEKFTEEPSKDKKSTNWTFEVCIIEEGSNKGRYMYGRFNSKAPGILIAGGFLPGALDNPNVSAGEFDPDALIGKEVYGLVTKDTYEGKLQSRTETWTTASAPPF